MLGPMGRRWGPGGREVEEPSILRLAAGQQDIKIPVMHQQNLNLKEKNLLDN